MSENWSAFSSGMLRARARDAVTLRAAVPVYLANADVPAAQLGEDAAGLPFCEHAGYFLLDDVNRHATIAVLGRDGIGEEARETERQALAKRVLAAFDGSPYTAQIDEHGRVTVELVMSRILSCDMCYEEDGEEVHPHPECDE